MSEAVSSNNAASLEIQRSIEFARNQQAIEDAKSSRIFSNQDTDKLVSALETPSFRPTPEGGLPLFSGADRALSRAFTRSTCDSRYLQGMLDRLEEIRVTLTDPQDQKDTEKLSKALDLRKEIANTRDYIEGQQLRFQQG